MNRCTVSSCTKEVCAPDCPLCTTCLHFAQHIGVDPNNVLMVEAVYWTMLLNSKLQAQPFVGCARKVNFDGLSYSVLSRKNRRHTAVASVDRKEFDLH